MFRAQIVRGNFGQVPFLGPRAGPSVVFFAGVSCYLSAPSSVPAEIKGTREDSMYTYDIVLYIVLYT